MVRDPLVCMKLLLRTAVAAKGIGQESIVDRRFALHISVEASEAKDSFLWHKEQLT
jgi:hypothetical protein